MIQTIKLCKVPGCGKPKTPHNSVLLCSVHHYRWITYKSYDEPVKKIISHKCKLDGCDRDRQMPYALCGMHRNRMSNHGSFEERPPRPIKSKPIDASDSDNYMKKCDIHGILKLNQISISIGKYTRKDGSVTTWERLSCKECNLEANRNWRLIKEFGISKEEYDYLFISQNGACAICKQASSLRLAVDHNHETGKNRGLLCIGCNTAFGSFKESVEILQNAIEYAIAHNT